MKTKIIATNETIKEIVKNEIKRLGKNANLNHIDTSKVTDMSYLFYDTIFYGDISKWDVSKVENMVGMFAESNFNQNISNWNVSNVECMVNIFLDSLLDCFHNKEHKYFNIFNKKESNDIKLIEQLIENKIDFGQDFISIINQLRKLEGFKTLVYDFENQKLKL